MTSQGPRLRLFVTGTDTGVGKTAVACGLVACWRRLGLRVHVMKPIETGVSHGPSASPSDAALLTLAAGVATPLERVSPCRYEEPVAPAVAARRSGVPVDMGRVVSAAAALAQGCDVLLVEGAGGLAVPITDELDMAGLAGQLGLTVLVVGRAGLGTINHCALTVTYARARGLVVTGIVLNGFSGTGEVAEETNPAEVARVTGCPVLACVPRLRDVTAEGLAPALLSCAGQLWG